jgi:hypothetical protein
MVIVYESKTGFTKKYADMLAAKTGMEIYNVKEISKIGKQEEIIFLGWMKVGRIQGLSKVMNKNMNIKAVCGSGTGRTAEPDVETILTRNNLQNIPFFYMRGGCFPLKTLKGLDRIMMTMFVGVLERSKDKDEGQIEAISIIKNGFDGVKEENLIPLLDWLNH